MIPSLLALCLAADLPAVVPAATAPTYSVANGAGSVSLLLNASTGSPLAVDRLVLNKGAAVPPHRHEGSAEILVIVSGSVDMIINGAPVHAGAGDAVQIPAGVEHSATAVEALDAVQIYTPPGPEQRFTAGPRLR